MYENAFNSIEKALRAEEGISNELDYVEQTSWVLFLKYLHDLESERRDRAELDGKTYAPIIDGEFRWDRWAAPKKDGQFDHNAALTGDDLVTFVDRQLFLGVLNREQPLGVAGGLAHGVRRLGNVRSPPRVFRVGLDEVLQRHHHAAQHATSEHLASVL